jgi:hypothetical protein
MPAALYDIRIDQAGYFARNIRLMAGESPYDLTGSTLAAQVRRGPEEPLIASFDTTSEDPVTGEFSLVLDDRARVLPKCELFWDLIVTDAAGIPRKILAGRVVRLGTITSPTP